AMDAVVQGWADNDPGAAARWASQLSSASQRNRLLKVALNALVADDPKAALDLARSLKPGATAAGLQASVFSQWADADPAGAAAAATGAQVNDAGVLGAIASAWATVDPAAAVSWVNGLPESPRKREMLRGFCDALAQADPKLATDFVS